MTSSNKLSTLALGNAAFILLWQQGHDQELLDILKLLMPMDEFTFASFKRGLTDTIDEMTDFDDEEILDEEAE